MMRRSLHIAFVVISVAGSVSTVFMWLGITPESAGEATYSLLYIALPIASFAFGLLAGWNAHALFAFRRYKVAGETIVLTKDQMRVVDRLRRGERFENPTQREFDILCQLGDRDIAMPRRGFNIDEPGWRLL